MFSILKKILNHLSHHPEAKTSGEKEVAEGGASEAGKSAEIQTRKIKTRNKPRKSGGGQKQKCTRTAQKKPPEVPEIRATRKQKSGSLPKKPSPKKSHKVVNRHGIPVLKRDADVSKYFQEDEKPPEPVRRPEITPQPGKKRRSEPPRKSPEKRPAHARNKNGIRVFRGDADFSEMFRDPRGPLPDMPPKAGGKTETPPDEENFASLLDAHMAGKSREAILEAKRDTLPPGKPPTRRQKVRNYPPPQEELDLHGFTSQEAVEKTEIFIRKARHKGKRTVLIIVGKGIHSEGRAVLPDVVENTVAELRKKNMVLTSEWEKGVKRKSGALIVYLKIPETSENNTFRQP
ncbi:hypothetical protein DENIS_3006 [Desulfonema ishimotonii]|uniref:Smr domain-containing protein n=1 Tax=Desulfonema ishimotonii TaxID=45657 RepID=A0A401FYL9_9BACT|nr:Smr/MutS family protein [Desulfonema ishimotonii]GBC62043.1 hypothetical protein DENIS_3006 [Desulfonema ishimotonii]